MKVDFHVHSTASDGTFSPSEIAKRARSFFALALTDHDNCDGVEELLACNDDSARRIAGIELSIEPGEGFDKFHLLGLGIDHRNEALRAFLKKVLEERNQRNERIIANFLKLGIDLANEIGKYAHGEVLARPHFAKYLVEHKYARSKEEAFAKYLSPESPKETRCYEERWHPSQEDAFKVVHQAGGICIMAHPKYWRDDWKYSGCDYSTAEMELMELREKGLDGMEALYEHNTNEENVEWTRIAKRLKYLTSAGSDFHGDTKPEISLGMEVSESFIAPLLERLAIDK